MVSLTLLEVLTPTPSIQKDDDRSFFRNRTFVLEIYKKVIFRSGWPDDVPSWAYLSAARYFRTQRYIHPTEAIPDILSLSLHYLRQAIVATRPCAQNSALAVTFVQQRARGYSRLLPSPSVPKEYAHVRSSVSLKHPVQCRTTAAHASFSVFNFFCSIFFWVDLGTFLFTVFKTIVIVVSMCVGLCAFAYLCCTSFLALTTVACR